MTKHKYFFLAIFVLFLFACKHENPELKTGMWRGAILPDSADKKIEIPFTFEVFKNDSGKINVVFITAGEKIKATDLEYKDDSLIINMPVFQDKFIVKVFADSLAGVYVHYGSRSNYTMPFYAQTGKMYRFMDCADQPAFNITGKWNTIMDPETENADNLVGEFSQEGNKVTGTFLATGGDFRYLEGSVCGNKLMLSGFDGTHTVVFTGEISNDTTIVNGAFQGGPKWKSAWIAKKDAKAVLANTDSVTYLKPGYSKVDFSFPNTEGKNISLSDNEFKNKVVILQIMGTWCPNCMDEANMMAGLYSEYKSKGLEIIGLSFENDDKEFSIKRMKKFKDNLGINYNMVYAGTPKKAGEALPMLNKVAAFPTAIFIDKKGNVRKITIGFKGPGTGAHFAETIKETRELIEKLLNE